MLRAKILGLGSFAPARVVSNDELRYLDGHHVAGAKARTETSDEWIRGRTGIEERRYAPTDGTSTCSDLALSAAKAALLDAACAAEDIDCIIFATLSPDIHFPGSAVFLQSKLGIDGIHGCACFDIRQQCSGFVYGLQMADAFVRQGLYKRILLVGAEIHSHSLDYSTRGRDVMVLFGDAAGAVVVGAVETADEREGVLYTKVGADGSGAMDLYLKVFGVDHWPQVWHNTTDEADYLVKYPQMNGKKVFLNAVRAMNLATREALEATGMGWSDIDWFVPHQANLRINEAVVQYAEVPPEKVLNSIHKFGNTTAASVPLTLDYHRGLGTVKKGHTVLSTVFGAGFTWGSAIFRL
jgi:3-oxoacyl-[acyl-carrier-protein] synthase-3